MTATACWWTVSGREDGRRRNSISTPGSGIWVPARKCGSGRVTTRRGGGQFQARYRAELADPDRARTLDALARLARRGRVTIVFGAHDVEHNQARVIAEELERRLAGAH
jgi:hypothetical protein